MACIWFKGYVLGIKDACVLSCHACNRDPGAYPLGVRLMNFPIAKVFEVAANILRRKTLLAEEPKPNVLCHYQEGHAHKHIIGFATIPRKASALVYVESQVHEMFSHEL